jgi:hypothetical protein
MHKYWNLTLSKQPSFYFLTSFPFCKKNKFHENMGTCKIGGAPPAKCTRILLLREIPQNTWRNKKGVVYGMVKVLPWVKQQASLLGWGQHNGQWRRPIHNIEVWGDIFNKLLEIHVQQRIWSLLGVFSRNV